MLTTGKSRGIVAALFYLLISVAYFISPLVESHWAYSVVLGPCEHFYLLIRVIDGLFNHLDKSFRISNSDFLWAVFHIAVWIIGLVLTWVCAAFYGTSRFFLLIVIFGSYWIAVSGINLFLFAIRSV